MIEKFSISRFPQDRNSFQVKFAGEPIMYREYHNLAMTQSSLVVDPRTIGLTFEQAKQYIFDEEAEHLACQAEAEQERYIAMNFDECGNRFRDGDEW